MPLPKSNPFSTDVASGSGKSLDLSNGTFATVSTGGTEDVFDGDNNFSVSMWVKGWPSEANQTLLSKNDFDPTKMGKLMSWLDADKPKHMAKVEGIVSPPADNESISMWLDKSGKGYHGIPNSSASLPIWKSTGLNGKPTVSTGNYIEIKNSGLDFDGWDKLHVFVVMKSNLKDWTRILGKTTNESSAANTAWHFSCRISWNDPQKLFFSATNSSGTNYWQENQHAENNSFKSATGGLLNLSYGSGSITRRVDGTQTDTRSVTGALKSLPNESVKLGKNYNINFSEFLIFNDKLSSTDELKVEGYLAHKWGLQGELPSGHAHKSNTPSFGGWAIERGPSGADDLTLNLSGAGDKFTKPVPMNDDLWHHLATTFGGGNKKIYIDGAEVGTTSQSGSITDSISRLILGDPNINSSSSYPKIDDVRFYRGVLTAAEVAAICNNGSGDIGQPKLAITSPSTFSGSTNKSISYQASSVTAYGGNWA